MLNQRSASGDGEQHPHQGQAHALLAAIVESSDDAIISKSLEGIVTSWNKGAERIFGYTAEEMIGRHISRLQCPGDIDMREILSKVQAGERVDHHQTRRLCKDGRVITVSLTVSPVRDSTGRIIGASKVARDITSQKLAEEALRKAEKLAVAGRMAASIAHEINNPLEAITNLLYLLAQEELSEQGRKYLTTAQQELSRVGHITVKTLGYHRQTAISAPVSVQEIVDEALALYKGRFVQHAVQVKTRYSEIPMLEANAGELRQVFANLIGNAVDAMLAGGRLQIRLRSATDGRTGRQGIRITIADSGRGMSDETKRRLLEPFYTTKDATGTGLGLWVSAEIVTNHGGRLSYRSSEGPRWQGSVFALFLPLAP